MSDYKNLIQRYIMVFLKIKHYTRIKLFRMGQDVIVGKGLFDILVTM